MMWRNSRENGGKSTVKKKFWKSHEKVKSGSYTGEKKCRQYKKHLKDAPFLFHVGYRYSWVKIS